MAVELQPELALKERLQKHSELTDVAREVLQILSSDDLLQKSKDSSETVEKISSKVRKGKENTTSTIEKLTDKKTKMEQVTRDDYHAAMEKVQGAPAEPDVQAVKEEIRKKHKQAREMEQDVKKLENEKKIIEFHKKHRKLQASISDVKFDMSSNDQQVKGYMKKPDGSVEVFKFDFSKDCPSYVADFLWDNL